MTRVSRSVRLCLLFLLVLFRAARVLWHSAQPVKEECRDNIDNNECPLQQWTVSQVCAMVLRVLRNSQ